MAPPKLDNIRLLVTDFAANLSFYQEVMGFTLPPGHGFPYVSFDTGGGTLALFDRGFMAQAIGTDNLPSAPASPSQDTSAVIFEVEDVDAAYSELKQRGVQFIAAPTDRKEWGIRTAHLRDPDGNLIELFTPLA